MSSRTWDYIAKIVMIGDSACGKSSLTIRLTDDRFSQVHDVTIAAEIGSKIVSVGNAGEHMKLQIWDTAGQEHFRAVTRSYFRNAAGCLLVYDVTRRSTFVHAKEWLDDIRMQADDDIAICLVGNKTDLVEEEDPEEHEQPSNNNNGNTTENSNTTTPPSQRSPRPARVPRQVSYDEAKKWASENSIFTFVETSAKDGSNVLEAYLRVSNEIHRKIVSGQYDLNDRSHGIKAAGTKRVGTAGSVGSSGGGSGGGRLVKLSMDAAGQNAGSKESSSSCC